MRHRPVQTELVGIVPPPFTIAPCDNRTAHLPECVHGFRLRRGDMGRSRIRRRLAPLRSRSGRRHHERKSLPQRVQQNLSFVMIPLNSG